MMNKTLFSALLTILALPVWAAQQSEIKASSPTGVINYQLSNVVDQESLVRGSVIIDCRGSRGTGIALDDRFILTAAHIVAAHILDDSKIRAFAVTKFNNEYVVPAQEWYMGSQDHLAFKPEYLKNGTFRELIIKKAHLHPETHMQKVVDDGQGYDLLETLNKYKEIMAYGQNNVEKFAAYGILTEFLN